MNRIVIVVCCLLFPASLVAQNRFDSTALKPLRSAIAIQKKQSPKIFANAATLPEEIETLDKKKRGPFLPVSGSLIAVGKELTLPLADLVLSQYDKPTLSGSAKVSFMVGAFETFAHHGDRVVVPLMLQVLQTETNRYIVRAASESVSRVGSDSDIAALLALPTTNDIRAGLRGCRRMACAQYLSTFVAQAADKQEQITALKALGSIGNAWAWTTSEVQSKDDGESVRRFAAQKLVAYYARTTDSDVRKTARKAILVVDHPETPEFVASARVSLDKPGQAAMDDLLRRFAKNPIR